MSCMLLTTFQHIESRVVWQNKKSAIFMMNNNSNYCPPTNVHTCEIVSVVLGCVLRQPWNVLAIESSDDGVLERASQGHLD